QTRSNRELQKLIKAIINGWQDHYHECGMSILIYWNYHDDLAVKGEQIMDKSSVITVKVEFSGGLELLFGKQKSKDVTFSEPETVKNLILWLKDNLLEERPELFVQDGSVRPGILVLVNDSDWELVGQLDYVVKSGDCITFISTLHGG
ncbi:hypothetical protein QYM36_001929, partial [Artemia franciscana]